MEKKDKGLTESKQVLINGPKIPPMQCPKIYLPKLYAQALKSVVHGLKAFSVLFGIVKGKSR